MELLDEVFELRVTLMYGDEERSTLHRSIDSALERVPLALQGGPLDHAKVMERVVAPLALRLASKLFDDTGRATVSLGNGLKTQIIRRGVLP